MRCLLPFSDGPLPSLAVIASAAKQPRATSPASCSRPWVASPAAGNGGDGPDPAHREARARPALSPTWLPAACLAAALALPAGGCTNVATGTAPAPSTGTLRERIAALALRQVDFGAISIIPVRFEKSRIAGPFEDGGRTLYCVSSRMTGRSFGKAERAKAVIRDQASVLTVLRDEEEVCEGHRTEPFQELDSARA